MVGLIVALPLHLGLLREADFFLSTAFCLSHLPGHKLSQKQGKPKTCPALDKQGKIFYEIPPLFPCPGFSLSRHTCAKQFSSRKTSSSTVQEPVLTAISDLFWRQKFYCCSLRWQGSRTEAWAISMQCIPLVSPRLTPSSLLQLSRHHQPHISSCNAEVMV